MEELQRLFQFGLAGMVVYFLQRLVRQHDELIKEHRSTKELVVALAKSMDNQTESSKALWQQSNETQRTLADIVKRLVILETKREHDEKHGVPH